jgi:hypothetical protein
VLGLNWCANIVIFVADLGVFFSCFSLTLAAVNFFFSVVPCFLFSFLLQACSTAIPFSASGLRCRPDVTSLSRGPLHRCTRPVLRCAALRVPYSAAPASFCAPHLYRSTEVAPVCFPLSKKKTKKIQQKIQEEKKEQKKQGRGTIGSTTSVGTVSGSQRAFSSFVFIFPFSFFICTCHQQRV